MKKLVRKSIITPNDRLNPVREEAALRYLQLRRGRGIYDSAHKVSKIAEKFVGEPKSKNAASLRLLKLRWQEIIGEQLAKLCHPEAIRGKTLVLRANGAAVPLLNMREKEILGLAALGCGVHFAKLGFISAPLQKPQPIKAKPKPLDSAASIELERKLDRVQSEGLKKALRLFNMSVQNK